MATAIQLVHEEDPATVMRRALKPLLDAMPIVMSARVLLGVYEKPDQKTKGGLYLPGQKREQDKYQGKVGLVLKMGPLAFKEDEHHKWGKHIPDIGDWVLFDVGRTLSLDTVNDRRVRFVEDTDIFAVVTDPDIVWSLGSVGVGSA